MKLRGVANFALLLLWSLNAAQGVESPEKVLVNGKIQASFRSIYAHLAYVFYYLAKRSKDVTEFSAKLAKYDLQIESVTKKVCNLLQMDVERRYEYLTSSLNLESEVIKGDEAAFADLKRVESDVKKALAELPAVLQIWTNNLDGRYDGGECSARKEKNVNLFRLIYTDYLVIFFNIAKSIMEEYKVAHKYTTAEEVFAKQIYVDGTRTYMGGDMYRTDLGDSISLRLIKHSNPANTDLLKRMFMDIKAQVKPLTPEMVTLIQLFEEYNRTFQSM